ncbi:MAG TPA: SGNH/GDSL hydrolase family protein [Bacteroidetes bacterium]|nr:SGNH/GDSL hydrolase family protein [Bacteroidota bacterium]
MILLVLALAWNDPDSRLLKWGKRNPWRMKLLRFSLLCALTFGVMEMGLRQYHYQPGFLFRQIFFHEVAKLEVRGDYWADQDGIYVWSPEAIAFLNGKISNNPKQMDWEAVNEVTYFTDFEFYQDYIDFHTGKVDNPFRKMITAIAKKPDSLRTAVEAAYYYQAFHPLNDAGFRSIAFQPYESSKRKILLIGDSFTWGHSAGNFTSGFADRLAGTGDIVYNAGISGTDPAQYEAIAQKYIPILQPDVVIVNFYMGNDIVNYQRSVEPYQMLFYHTNAGNLMAFPGPERLVSPQAAYEFVRAEMKLPVTGLLSRLCASTAVTTLAWRFLQRHGVINPASPNDAYWQRCASRISQKPVSGLHLKAIQKTCQAHHAQFILAVIPDLDQLHKQIPADFPGLFDGLPIAVPAVSSADYQRPDAHFNAQGHEKYTLFLQNEIAKRFPARQ